MAEAQDNRDKEAKDAETARNKEKAAPFVYCLINGFREKVLTPFQTTLRLALE